MAVSDEELCQRVAQHDETAFESLVERHQEKTYRLAWSILKDADEAQDLSQEAFIRLHQAAASFDGRSRFTTWFYRIVVNLCLDHRRKHRGWRRLFCWPRAGDDPEAQELDQIASPTPGPEEEASGQQTAARLWAAVEKLSDKQRTALLLTVQEGMSSREIAAVLACSEATARVHLHRAMSALKKTV